MTKVMVNLTLNHFSVYTDDKNDVVWFDSIKTIIRDELEKHEIGFRGDELETYILKIFEKKNLFKKW